MADPIRRDVYKMDPWDDTLLWYARAVAEMQKRPIDDPTSWRFQSAIHEYIRNKDPLRKPDDPLPSTAEQKRFWNQCQHFSWYFLPWHRMYLGVFEQIVADTVQKLGGKAGWTLPYWNYSDASNPAARQLPRAFRDELTPDGVPNPLRVAHRSPPSNKGQDVADDDDVEVQSCLTEEVFASSPVGGGSSFGGPETGFNHDGGNAMGTVDRVPHGTMHGAVGGNTGWMSFFNTAALDPIFWLHHANIDRLWTVWLRRDPAHVNPDDARWQTKLSFEFRDVTGSVVSFTPSQVTDTGKMPSPLASYRYEVETDPLAEGGGLESVESGRSDAMPEPRMTEMVGATHKPLVLTGRPASTRLAATPPTGPALESATVGGGAGETFLNVENITGSEPQKYAVYVNLPEGDAADEHPELLAGVLPMFGVREASGSNEGRAGSGLHYVLKVGEIVRTLQERDDWDPSNIRLTFVPKGRGRESETGLESVQEVSPIEVGRVSLHVG
jgi:tyrosinase